MPKFIFLFLFSIKTESCIFGKSNNKKLLSFELVKSINHNKTVDNKLHLKCFPMKQHFFPPFFTEICSVIYSLSLSLFYFSGILPHTLWNLKNGSVLKYLIQYTAYNFNINVFFNTQLEVEKLTQLLMPRLNCSMQTKIKENLEHISRDSHKAFLSAFFLLLAVLAPSLQSHFIKTYGLDPVSLILQH